MKIDRLKITSCQAPNADFIGHNLAAYIQTKVNTAAEFVGDIPWPERERLLDEGAIDIGWICGLPYVRKADRPRPDIELLAAPVMAAPRYRNRPVYFSDVVVRQNSPFFTFAELRGASWAYNETGSHSGYNITRYNLAKMGETTGYFGRVVESGGHEISLQMLLNEEIDASAIDSTVLETELARDPALAAQFRVVAVWGPSPIPPWVIGRHVPAAWRQALQRLIVTMHEDEDGRSFLTQARMARFVPIQDAAYYPIREMERLAQTVTLAIVNG